MSLHNTSYIRPMDIKREQHPHKFDKYHNYDRFILEASQYDEIIARLKGNIDQLVLEVNSTFEKGVIVADQVDTKHVMHYVFSMDRENYVIHAFNSLEGYLFTLELKNGAFMPKEINPLLSPMPREELNAFQRFASNYYFALMFYLSINQEEGLSSYQDKYIKHKKKGKRKISRTLYRTIHALPSDWHDVLPQKEKIKEKSVTKIEAEKIVESHKRREKKSLENHMGIEVKGHYRTLKNGKKIWVEGYKRVKNSG